jgi:hypothetical protein
VRQDWWTTGSTVLPARNLLFNYSDHVVGVCGAVTPLKLQIAEAQGSRRRVLVVPKGSKALLQGQH